MIDSVEVLRRLNNDLERGQVDLSLLGEEAPAESTRLPLDTPEAMGRYAQMMRPIISETLANNKWLEKLLVGLLVALFVVATALTVTANFKGWAWASNGAVIPGLGVAAVWPIRRLAKLRQESIALELIPVLLPLMSADDARDFVKKTLRSIGA